MMEERYKHYEQYGVDSDWNTQLGRESLGGPGDIDHDQTTAEHEQEKGYENDVYNAEDYVPEQYQPRVDYENVDGRDSEYVSGQGDMSYLYAGDDLREGLDDNNPYTDGRGAVEVDPRSSLRSGLGNVSSGLYKNSKKGGSRDQPGLEFSDEDVQILACWTLADLRAFTPPDTRNISNAFKHMLSRVRERAGMGGGGGGAAKGPKANALTLAAERCLEGCGGKGKRAVPTDKFARALNTLSIQWSGFTLEECQALGELLDNDGDGVITVDDISAAIVDSSVADAPRGNTIVQDPEEEWHRSMELLSTRVNSAGASEREATELIVKLRKLALHVRQDQVIEGGIWGAFDSAAQANGCRQNNVEVGTAIIRHALLSMGVQVSPAAEEESEEMSAVHNDPQIEQLNLNNAQVQARLDASKQSLDNMMKAAEALSLECSSNRSTFGSDEVLISGIKEDGRVWVAAPHNARIPLPPPVRQASPPANWRSGGVPATSAGTQRENFERNVSPPVTPVPASYAPATAARCGSPGTPTIRWSRAASVVGSPPSANRPVAIAGSTRNDPDRFDPPSARNGYTGLLPAHIDQQFSASTPSAMAVQGGEGMVYNTSASELVRIIKAPGSKGSSPKNQWDPDRRKWIGCKELSEKNVPEERQFLDARGVNYAKELSRGQW